MRLNVCTLTGAFALTALFAPPAQAQNLAQEVASGQHAPQSVPLTIGAGEGARVIKSHADAVAAGVHALAPPGFQPNFHQEMLLVAVDQRPRGPGRVAIDVRRKSLFSTSFFSIHFLEVTVKRLVPGSVIGTPSAIRPFALVKLPRSNEAIQMRVVSETMPAPPPPGPGPMIFTAVVRQLTNQPAINWTGPGGAPNVHRSTEQVDVRADGQVVISRWSTPGLTGTPPITGTATQAELRELNRALRRARLNGIPSQLGGAGFPQFSLTGLGLPAGDKTITGVRGAEGAFKPRLDGVHAALDAIAARLSTPSAPPVSFNTVSRSTRFPLRRRREALLVDGSGNATLTVRRRNRPARSFSGTLTAAETQALSRAVRRSRLRRVPGDLPTPIHVVPGDTFELKVDARRPGNSNTVRGEIGYYGQHTGRVQPIMDALDAIAARLRPNFGPGGHHGGGGHGLAGHVNNP